MSDCKKFGYTQPEEANTTFFTLARSASAKTSPSRRKFDAGPAYRHSSVVPSGDWASQYGLDGNVGMNYALHGMGAPDLSFPGADVANFNTTAATEGGAHDRVFTYDAEKYGTVDECREQIIDLLEPVGDFSPPALAVLAVHLAALVVQDSR